MISLTLRKNSITGLLRITLILMFLGRAWQHLVWEGPYRNIFYNPHGFGKFLAWVSGDNLVNIYSDPFYENLLDGFYRFVGVVFVLGAVATFLYSQSFKFKKIAKLFVISGGFLMILVSYGYFVGKHYLVTMFFEHSIQMFLPFAFLLSFRSSRKLLIVMLQLTTAVTFICHGLFAYGFHPQPGGFADMMIVFFGMKEEIARKSLVHIAELDFVFAAIILIPFQLANGKQLVRRVIYYILFVFLVYGVFWGYATAFARILVHFDSRFPFDTINGYLYETLVRIGHGTFPLVLLIQLYKNNKMIKG